MPKVAVGQYAKQNERLVKKIKLTLFEKEMKACKLAGTMGISRNTHFNYMKKPETITIGALRKYIKILNIPKEDIIAALYLED